MAKTKEAPQLQQSVIRSIEDSDVTRTRGSMSASVATKPTKRKKK